ncbi:uncharacterized protein LOC135809125 [Sycon ciliatum]|uniref:uncharacterized protein LOC135809125 n=1 Tax=Sycon ciliatum TaxID=27933 RepID=UPI0031F62BF5
MSEERRISHRSTKGKEPRRYGFSGSERSSTRASPGSTELVELERARVARKRAEAEVRVAEEIAALQEQVLQSKLAVLQKRQALEQARSEEESAHESAAGASPSPRREIASDGDVVFQRSRDGASATLRSCMPPRAESDSAVTGSRFTTDPPLPLARPSVENANTLVAGTAAAQLSQNVPDVVDGVSEESDHYVSSSSASSSDTAGDSTTTGTTTNASSGESDNSHTDSSTVSHYGPASRRVGTRALANAGVASRGGAACTTQPVHMQQQRQQPPSQQQLQQVHVLGSAVRPMLLEASGQAQPSPAAPRRLMTPKKKKLEKRQKNKDKAEQAASLCSAMTETLSLNPGAVPFQPAKQTLLPGPQLALPGHQMASPGFMPWNSPYAVTSHLKALELPKFDGKVKSYLKWRQRFLRLIDDSYAMSENHKLAHLREALADGSAEELIADVLDGPGAYKAIMAELERWYGGQDRELNNQERELMEWPVLTNERDVSQLKKFAIRLRNTLLNMEAVQVQPGRELYLALTRKIPRRLLARYFDRYDDSSCDIQAFSQFLITHVQKQMRVEERIGLGDRPPVSLQPKEHQNKSNRPLPSRQYGVRERAFISSPGTPRSSDSSQPGPKRNSVASSSRSNSRKEQAASEQRQHADNSHACGKCEGAHHIADCGEFKSLPVQKRNDTIRNLRLCVNCLGDGHWARDCMAAVCRECQGKHHHLLHRERQGSFTPSPPTRKEASHHVNSESQPANDDEAGLTSFMTIPVKVANGTVTATANVLLDSGSTCSFVTERLAHRLRLRGERKPVHVGVLGGQVLSGEREVMSLSLHQYDSQEISEVEAYVLPKITSDVHVADWSRLRHQWPHLADIDFPAASNQRAIDILIGLNSAALHSAQEERSGKAGEPIARRTPLGWVCFGSAIQDSSVQHTHHALELTQTGLDSLVRNFWDLEAVGMQPSAESYLSPDERHAEEMTRQQLGYADGRFVVGIPWQNGARPQITSNRVQAEDRLRSLLRSLERRPTVQIRYAKVLEEYLQKAYIQELTSDQVQQCGREQWFLPHFAVVREDKATTKVRVVFDAAARFNGTSINEHMYAGPRLQNDLVTVLIRFCMHPVALIADVSEMFLQVSLQPEDRRYHRFLWKTGDGVKAYEFTRLAFGIRASPYLAGRALLETAERFGANYDPAVSDTVRKAFYVDDMLKSLPDDQKAMRLRSQLQDLLKKGGFHLRKWLSNSEAVMESIPPEHRAPATSKSITAQESSGQPSQKALGVTWMVSEDYFTFHYQEPTSAACTKRTVLSRMASLFDPRGQLAPFTIRSKLLFQELCLAGLGWDDPLPKETAVAWQEWFAEMPKLTQLRIDRCFQDSTTSMGLSVHTFTDASERAYAAASYVRAERPDGTAKVTLVMAKARPAPIKRRSIPMLELQGAVLGVRLGTYVSEALGVRAADSHYWSDSMNVQYWIRSPSRKFKLEVGNRISEIQQQSMARNWRHVPGVRNPADLPTRGMTVTQLAEESRWWHGPTFLAQQQSEWPDRRIAVPKELPQMLKTPEITMTAMMSPPLRLSPNNYSSWSRLVRVTAWCMRAIHNRRKSRLPQLTLSDARVKIAIKNSKEVAVPELSPAEFERAEHYWIMRAQDESYGEVTSTLRKGKELPSSAPLLKLQPRIDEQSGYPVLRVSGRLRTAYHLASEFRSPIILPPRHRVTELIIRREDERCRHSIGTNHLLSNLADHYWLVKGKQMVKSHRHHCVGCQKVWRKPATPRMGPLPDLRTQGPLLAFARTAVDFAGPFLVKRGRGRTQEKRYVAVFTCLQSRACHLELVTSLDTTGFKMALTRFCKRRGTPEMLLTDNGSNFVATERELREAVAQLDHADLTSEYAGQGIEWKFNPPRSPHFGGVFERIVRSMKQVLQTVLYKADLTEEELQTVLVQAEALINSRPLTTLSEESEDLEPLTPLHFLVGHSRVATALEATPEGGLHRRWQLLQDLMKRIWKRWLREIVARANLETKWHRDSASVTVGKILMMLDESLPRTQWPLGRVVATYPGKDGKVRVVDVKVKGKVYKRSVHRLVPLDVEPSAVKVTLPASAEVRLSDLNE